MKALQQTRGLFAAKTAPSETKKVFTRQGFPLINKGGTRPTENFLLQARYRRWQATRPEGFCTGLPLDLGGSTKSEPVQRTIGGPLVAPAFDQAIVGIP